MCLKNVLFCEFPFGKSLGLLRELKALFCAVLAEEQALLFMGVLCSLPVKTNVN